MKKSKKKGIIIAASALGVASLIGVTIAYNQDVSSFNNKFELASYRTLFTETFDSPSNWVTCQTIDKTLTVKNESEGDVAVRIKLEEQWLASDGVTELPLTSVNSNLEMAQINFAQNSGWTKNGAYYYYDTDLTTNASTTTPITGVTLNCNANLSPNGSPSDSAYANATYHLKITAQTTESEVAHTRYLYDIVANQKNELGNYTVDFRRPAASSNNVATANGNGVDTYSEKNTPVYYFRGDVDNNHVIWRGKCWKMVRTTYSGGVKMIYNGVPTSVQVGAANVDQCLASGVDAQISVGGVNKFKYNTDPGSVASGGYMYGDFVGFGTMRRGSIQYTFSNSVTKVNGEYHLNTDSGEYITDTWANARNTAATRYHYFCTDGSTVCSGDKIGYIYYYGDAFYIEYIPVDGYDGIGEMMAAMNNNINNSNAKGVIDSWFATEGLDAYEDDLEDAIFCNDRSYKFGPLKGENEEGMYNYSSASARNYDGPSLDCSNKNDAFTKSDSTNGNAKLRYKVGLITQDEVVMAGSYSGGYDPSIPAYLNSGEAFWTMSPSSITLGNLGGAQAMWAAYNGGTTNSEFGLRPMVSLKTKTKVASGTGLKTDPYILDL